MTALAFLNSTTYGAVGDGITNDYAALQAFLNDLGSIGGTGFLAPGQYYISGGDLTLGLGAAIPALKLSAHGARILTDPTQARTGLKVTRTPSIDHNDGPRKVIIEGLQIDHFGNPGAVYGIKVEGAWHVVIRDCVITAGGNGAGPGPNPNYQAICLNQTNPHDGDTSCFWSRIENVNIVGGAVKVPAGIVLYGQDNATSINKCDFSYVGNVILLYADSDGNVANSVRITDSDFERCDQCIMFASFIAAYTTVAGLVAAYNRAESCGTFFYYRLSHNPASGVPVMGPNFMIATAPIYNPSGLAVTNY